MKGSKLIPVVLLLLAANAFAGSGSGSASSGSSGTGSLGTPSSTPNQSLGGTHNPPTGTPSGTMSNPSSSNQTTTGIHNSTDSTSNADNTLTTSVQQRFQSENIIGDSNSNNINIRSSNGTVYLTGTANTQEEADRAASIAKSIEGVKNVNNSIQVQTGR